MSYRFNPFTGRIREAPPLKSYQPQGFQQDIKPPESFQFATSDTRAVDVRGYKPHAAAGATDFGIIPSEAGYQKIVAHQSELMSKMHLFVWQKRGMIDKTWYLGTMALTLGCIAYCAKGVWDMSWPAAKKED